MKKCFDVVIIGAGLTGSLAADHFTRLGKEVCIIERGGDYRPDSRQYWSSEHIPVADTNRWVTVARDDPYERVEMIGLKEPNFKYNMKFGVGGSMAVWTAIAFRFSPSDFKLRSRYGVGDDWPISYEALAPWYEMAERELGVSGESGLSLWPRNSFYPMPAFRKSYLDRVFEKYFGVTFPMVPIPAGVASEKYRGRGPCIGAQSCEAFCPAEAKYDPAQTHLAAALKRPNCTLIKRAFVKKILLADETDLVERVQVFPENMAPLEIQGKLFILAANTVENTRLLLHSATDRFPTGLANRNGLLGKYFMSTGAFVWNLEFPEMTYPGRGRPITSVCIKYADGPHRKYMPSFVLELWNNAWTQGSFYEYSEKLIENGEWGSSLKKKLERYLRQIPVVAPFEILPNKNNTLTLDNRQTDSFGMPLPATLINWSEFEHRVRGFVEKRLTSRLARVRRRLFGYGTNGNHPYGTYRMGASRQYGVVDCNLRSFDHENLYILGGGSFVTGTCFNPSLTIAALTFKALNSITDRAFSS